MIPAVFVTIQNSQITEEIVKKALANGEPEKSKNKLKFVIFPQCWNCEFFVWMKVLDSKSDLGPTAQILQKYTNVMKGKRDNENSQHYV